MNIFTRGSLSFMALLCLSLGCTVDPLAPPPDTSPPGRDRGAPQADRGISDIASSDVWSGDQGGTGDLPIRDSGQVEDRSISDQGSPCAPLTSCGDTCVDTDTALEHCGGCNSSCAALFGPRVNACLDGDCICDFAGAFPCPEGQICSDVTGGCATTCPEAQQCGTECCAASQVCAGGVCCTAELACGSACCGTGEVCAAAPLCCDAKQACGSVCCPPGETCLADSSCCPPTQICGGSCCGQDQICLNGDTCAAWPTGATAIYHSSAKHTGALGGRSGADAICAGDRPATLSCSYVRAFLSASVTDQILDMHTAGVADKYESSQPLYFYKAADNSFNLFAASWPDALDGSITISASTGTGVNDDYWTGSKSDGSLYLQSDFTNCCVGWTTEGSVGPGCDDCAAIYGKAWETDHKWLGYSLFRGSCAYEKYILCVCKL